MARIRPGRCYRKIHRAYTRTSRRKPRESYVKGVPAPKIRIFDMGSPNMRFDSELSLKSKGDAEIRHNALEAARVAANRLLSKKLEKDYHFKVLVYPHQIQRENPMAYGHKADRYGMGMRLSFGKPMGFAARVRKDQRIMLLRFNKDNAKVAREALERATHKLPIKTRIE